MPTGKQPPQPTLLDVIAAETDPLEGLRQVTKYVKDGEEKLREARLLRARFTFQARQQQRTWQTISEAAGKTDVAYLRREMEDARRPEEETS